MLVSVIIPVYNAEEFVRQAVESALAQPETGEVLMIEDASTDGSLRVCQQLAREYPQVRLLGHADGRNHGAGASRNLGILRARCDYIAFLDADDYFLPSRFSVAKDLFASDPELDGVYEAMGTEFEDSASEQRWLGERGYSGLRTMKERVAPGELFEKQSPLGPCGYCATGGWVVRRSIFDKTGLFDEHLRLHQDTVMYVKFAAVGRMLAGRLHEPVVIRRVHATNRSSLPRPPFRVYRDRIKMWAAIWSWAKRSLSLPRQHLVLQRFLSYASCPYRAPNSVLGMHLLPRIQLTGLAICFPGIALEREFWLHYRRVMLPFGLRQRLASIRRSMGDPALKRHEKPL